MFDDKVSVPKFAVDGSNWVTYSKMMLWIVNSMELQEQLGSMAMTPRVGQQVWHTRWVHG